MPKTRIEVAHEVRDAFSAAEQAVEQSAAAIARCVAVLIEARARARLSPIAGADVIALMAKGAQSSLDARQCVLAAHPLLAEIGRELRVIDFGPSEECVPNRPFVSATTTLRVVGEVA